MRGLVVDGVGVPIIHALPLTNLICKPRGRYRAPVAVSSPKPVSATLPCCNRAVEARPVDLIATWPPGSRRWRPRCDLRGDVSRAGVISRPKLTRLKFLNRGNFLPEARGVSKWRFYVAVNTSDKFYQDIFLFFVLCRFMRNYFPQKILMRRWKLAFFNQIAFFFLIRHCVFVSFPWFVNFLLNTLSHFSYPSGESLSFHEFKMDGLLWIHCSPLCRFNCILTEPVGWIAVVVAVKSTGGCCISSSEWVRYNTSYTAFGNSEVSG